MQRLDPREYDSMDAGDRLSFALSGAAKVATDALRENVMPGPRGWVTGYPERVAADLEYWAARVREVGDSKEDRNAQEP